MASGKRQSKLATKSGVAPAHDHSKVLTDDNQINISQSKVKVWRQCHRQYYWKFVLMIQKKLRKRPFMFGGIAHEICEADFEGKDWNGVLDTIELDNKKLFKREIEMYGNIVEDMRDIMTDYFAYWEGTDSEVTPIKHNGRRSEHEFRIELDDALWFTGKIDAVVKAKKMRWVMEHKTFSRMPGEDERWKSVQGSVYFRALEEMGFPPIDGVLWDYISSKAPSVPGQLTSTGRISQARIDSVPSRLRRWIKENGFKRSDYAKLLESTRAGLSTRYIRLFSPVKRPVVDMIWNDFVDTAREIRDNHGTKQDMNVGKHCSWCDYQPLCKALLTGADVDWILKRDYQQEDQSHKRDQVDHSDD